MKLLLVCVWILANTVTALLEESFTKFSDLINGFSIPFSKGFALERLTTSKLPAINVTQSLALDLGGTLAKALFIERGEFPSSPNEEGNGVKNNHNSRLLSHPRWSGLTKAGGGKEYDELTLYVPELNGTLHFFTFETRYIKNCINFVGNCRARNPAILGDVPGQSLKNIVLRATGGGSYKFAQDFADIGIQLDRRDEMACVVNGVSFLLQHVPQEVFSVNSAMTSTVARTPLKLDFKKAYKPKDAHPFPYLLVNIGSGVSIILVKGPRNFKRVSGSSLGGATFFGLSTLLTTCKNFDEVINLTRYGDLSKVDMLVGDIYSEDVKTLGLAKDVIASSFGKAVLTPQPSGWTGGLFTSLSKAIVGTVYLWLAVLANLPIVPLISKVVKKLFGLEDKGFGFQQWLTFKGAQILMSTGKGLGCSLHHRWGAPDLAISLLRMISNNIGQIAYLNARQFGINKIYFGGNFIRKNEFTMSTISSAVEYWSNGTMQALFLNHEGFSGALGAYLCGTAFSMKMLGELFSIEKDKSCSLS